MYDTNSVGLSLNIADGFTTYTINAYHH